MQIIAIIFTNDLQCNCQIVYKKLVCLSNQFFYYIFFDILFLGDEMEDNKLKEMILDNRDLIYSIIHKFRSRDIEDLFQAGCVGLIKAYKNYKEELNVKFTSYAYNYIVGEIYQFIINNRNIRMSPANNKLLKTVGKAREYLTNHLGRNPTDDELCSFLEIEPYKYNEIKNMMFIENIDNNENSMFYYNQVSKDDLIDLKTALNCLTLDEKRLINARYYNNYTQSELAKLYHTNQVKVSREEKKILCKLKANM